MFAEMFFTNNMFQFIDGNAMFNAFNALNICGSIVAIGRYSFIDEKFKEILQK